MSNCEYSKGKNVAKTIPFDDDAFFGCDFNNGMFDICWITAFNINDMYIYNANCPLNTYDCQLDDYNGNVRIKGGKIQMVSNVEDGYSVDSYITCGFNDKYEHVSRRIKAHYSITQKEDSSFEHKIAKFFKEASVIELIGLLLLILLILVGLFLLFKWFKKRYSQKNEFQTHTTQHDVPSSINDNLIPNIVNQYKDLSKKVCMKCNGAGCISSESYQVCLQCSGRGFDNYNSKCLFCNGFGKMKIPQTSICDNCSGKGHIESIF